MQNRAFFFGDFEGFRQDKKATAFSTLPTSAQDSGILSVDIRDPRTGAVYPAGTPIHAPADGTVVMAGTYGGYGNATIIDHGNGVATLYGHQSRILVSQGQRVVRGETIGLVEFPGLLVAKGQVVHAC